MHGIDRSQTAWQEVEKVLLKVGFDGLMSAGRYCQTPLRIPSVARTD